MQYSIEGLLKIKKGQDQVFLTSHCPVNGKAKADNKVLQPILGVEAGLRGSPLALAASGAYEVLFELSSKELGQR